MADDKSKDKEKTKTKSKRSKKKSYFETTGFDFPIFHLPGEDVELLPWNLGERGRQKFLKLTRGEEEAFFHAGGDKVEAERQKALMMLSNDGWQVQGRVEIDFDGKPEDEFEELFQRDLIRVEIGLQLLPLVDPNQGAPLLAQVKDLRKEIADITGFVTPGIRIKDNLDLPPNDYVVFLKETPVASGEIFLDRMMVMGPLDKLGNLKGWSTKDPAYGGPAKWIEREELEAAEKEGCLILGPLNIMRTHLRESIAVHLKDLLGLQEVKMMLDRLMETHPIVVEDFIKDKKKIRLVRKILQNLAGERVSIKDLVTIMETVGDFEDELHKTDLVTEMARIALARQICWSYLDPEGKIPALVLSREFEEKIQNSVKETKHGLRLTLSTGEVDAIIRNIRKILEDFKNPPVVFCDPPSRLYFRRLTEPSFPHLGILSTAEIVRGMKVEILGEVGLPSGMAQAGPSVREPEEEDEEMEEIVEEKKEPRGILDFFR